jgi:CDP-diacylglycerol--glycerol-3-phosphate 3-phosphatidyltransferase
LMTGLADLLNLFFLIPLTLALLALASTITVIQRILLVRGQARATA